MKFIKLFAIFILFITAAIAQEKLPIIKSNVNVISIQDGKNFGKDAWTLVPEAKPDIYEALLIDGKPHEVTFITDVDKITFKVELDKKYDFIIQKGETICYTQIVGRKFIPAARFNKKYQKERKGKMFVEVPEVYELVNIAIALTPTAITNKNLVYQHSDYYKNVRSWFDKYKNHPLITAFETELKKTGQFRYEALKMNGYAFDFDKKGKIINSKIFDRTGWGASNELHPFLTQLQSFSDITNFREFFKQNRKTYEDQRNFFLQKANLAEMKRWLDKNFPKSNNYDTYNIIFSPLVAYNQSSNWFESNGFKELQPHVNFPYSEDVARWNKNLVLSEESQNVFRGIIVFTEINHGYINPEADKYADRIRKATSNRDVWIDKQMGANYYPDLQNFNEYMNWGLINLRTIDYIPAEDQQKVIDIIDDTMAKGRGFIKFKPFSKFLVDLYRRRQPNQTIADLYPQIIEWFEKNNTK